MSDGRPGSCGVNHLCCILAALRELNMPFVPLGTARKQFGEDIIFVLRIYYISLSQLLRGGFGPQRTWKPDNSSFSRRSRTMRSPLLWMSTGLQPRLEMTPSCHLLFSRCVDYDTATT